jgi:TolA-binding protein
MKRKERRHLKENDLAHSITTMREFVEPRSKQLVTAGVIVVVLIVAVLGVTIVRRQMQNRGQAQLADAMVALNARVVPPTATAQGEDGNIPAAASIGATGTFSTEAAKLNAALPKLKAAADAYPDAPAGIAARYHLGGALASLGRYPEAIKEFEAVAQKAGSNSLYGRMSRLGKADAEVRSGQLDAAIASLKELATQKDTEVPVDAVLMELAKAYAQKGNTDDARKTYTELVDQHPQSPYSAEARQELHNLKS